MPATVIAERIGWRTPNSGIDLSTLGAKLDVCALILWTGGQSRAH
jgi:hypothetical protein